MIKIDGSYGEGGGQILRTSLGLSLVTGKPFTLTSVRAGRAKSGLLRQHLTAVQAASQISNASVRGNTIQSTELTFHPAEVQGGTYTFSVSTAGSATLVLQTILPALMTTREPSMLTLSGGTHNPFAPPFDFLKKAFLRMVNQMGPQVTVELEKYGFYPAGGGRFSIGIAPVPALNRMSIVRKGPLRDQAAFAFSSKIATRIGREEMKLVARKVGWERRQCIHLNVDSPGPGNLVTIQVEHENVTEVFTGFGQRGRPLAKVVGHAVDEFLEYEASGAPIGPYLADQLLVPMAVAGGGKFVTMKPTQHTLTNIEIVKQFIDISIRLQQLDDTKWQIKLGE